MVEKDLRELRVFMASPGDLTDERDALRNLERRLNAMFRARGVRVSIEGWEEVLPDAGAPQDLINPLVHDCDVFVGLLNRRWGTPTDNDSSGFSEEFNIALMRRKESANQRPAIGMYFRVIDPDRLRDIGPQLESVLAFKERVEAERLVLHKPFSSADHLELEVMNFLLPHVLRLADDLPPAITDLDAGSSGSTTFAEDKREAVGVAGDGANNGGVGSNAPRELDSAQRQIVAALTNFSHVFSGQASLDPEARDRVTLVDAAFAKEAGMLGPHHVNRLFKRRAHLDLTVGEMRIWYRTFFENYASANRSDRIIPMWGVIDLDQIGDQFIADLGHLALDEDPNVVRGVLQFMAKHHVRPESFWGLNPTDAESEGTPTKSQAAQGLAARWVKIFERFPGIDSALNYVGAVASAEDAPLLMRVAESDELDERTRDLIRALVDVMVGDVLAVASLAPSRYSGDNTSALRDLVVNSIPGLPAEHWMGLITGTHKEVAVAAARQIIEHEGVSKEQLKAMVDLRSAEIESALVDRAVVDPEWASLQLRALSEIDKYRFADLIDQISAVTLPREALEHRDRDETLSATAWVALTIQEPHRYLESAREVLDGTSEWLNERNAPLTEKYALIAEHTNGTAKGAACIVLSTAPEITDLDIERVVTELRRDSYVSRSAALRALVTMVSRLDADPDRILPDLGNLSVLDSYVFVDDKDLVLDSALARFAVPVWRDSEIETLRYSSRAWELRRSEVSDADLEEALYLDSQDLRMDALDQLMSRWTDQQLNDLLWRYDNRGRAWWGRGGTTSLLVWTSGFMVFADSALTGTTDSPANGRFAQTKPVAAAAAMAQAFVAVNSDMKDAPAAQPIASAIDRCRQPGLPYDLAG